MAEEVIKNEEPKPKKKATKAAPAPEKTERKKFVVRKLKAINAMEDKAKARKLAERLLNMK